MPDSFDSNLDATAELLRRSALQAARKAGELLRQGFRTGITAEHKTNPHDLVTSLDRRSQELITSHLRAAVPGSWVLGEEQVQGASGIHTPGSVQWIVDPIDGTSNFVHGVAFFAVSIAAAIDHRLVASVVLDPMSGEEFTANLSEAFFNETPLHPSPRPEQSRANLMTDYPGAESLAADGQVALEVFGQWVTDFATVRRKVCASLALAYVAAGWCDASIGFDTKVWDVAAGVHLIRTSGGTYRPLTFDEVIPADHYARGFIALGPQADYPSLEAAAGQITELRRGSRQQV